MRLLTYLICFLALSAMAYAGLDVDEVKVYVNNERFSDADKDGGTIRAAPSDVIEFVIRLDNTFNYTVQGKLNAKINDIDNGDDLTKEQDWYDITANNDRAKTLTFDIPVDATKDEYDMVLTVYKRINSSETTSTIDYVIDIRPDAESTDIDLKGSFNNLTNTCNNVVNGMNTCFGYINASVKYLDEVSTCKEERGTYLTGKTTCENDLNTCNTLKTSLNSEKANCESQKSNMKTIEQCNTEISEAKTSSQNLFMMLGGGALLIWFIYNNKKKKGSTGEAYDYYKQQL